MGGNGAGSGVPAQEFQTPILPQSQISTARPIWPNFATTFEPQAVTWTSPISFAENDNFFGLEYSNIPLDNADWDGRMPCVLFLAQRNSSQSSYPSDHGHDGAQLGNANYLQPGRKAIEVANSWAAIASTEAEMPAVTLGKRKGGK